MHMGDRPAHLEGAEQADDVLVLQGGVHSHFPEHLVVIELTEVLHVVYLERNHF